MHRGFAVALAALLLTVGAARAQDDFTPAVLFDLGGKFDKSFNEAAYNGAERFTAETGIDYLEFELTNEAQRPQALRRMAQRADVVVAVGFSFATPLEEIAPQFPDTRFTIIDAVVEAPNVQSVVFEEHEGSFLVGMLAAMAAEGGAVGFVGGMDIPLIRNFLHGYVQGAKHVNPDVEVIANMTGDTPAAWNDPTKGAELARSQFARGADVVYHAAGGTGTGVIQAAADVGKLAIGVDSNQNHLAPGHVLTSMIKRVDNAVHDAFASAREGTWEPGERRLGLAEDGVGWALDEHNRDLVTAEMEQRVEEAKRAIVEGRIEVEDYYSAQR